jgi:signal transduction histidine kinase
VSAAPQDLRLLIEQLAHTPAREGAAGALAAAIGVRRVLLYVRDPQLQVMLPAPGMAKTVAGGPLWRQFLRDLGDSGNARAQVDLDGETTFAAAHVASGVALVLVGGTAQSELPVPLRDALPLLAAALRSEFTVQVVRAESAQAHEAASRAHQLAKALDAARASSAQLNNQLRLEHQRKDEFLAMLAHELRNPLAPIVSALEILRRSSAHPLTAASSDKLFGVMTRQLQQLTHLVDDLLDVSRVSRGLIELRLEDLRLQHVIDSAIDATRALLEGRGHRLSVQGDEQGSIHVRGDRVRLLQVFSNLLNNAAKYTEPGGRLQVRVGFRRGQALVEVQDSGIGIPPDLLGSIFDLFAQVPGSLDRAPGGLGIGLTLVRTLVELHGGTVKAASPGLGHGSTFTVTLPLVPEPQPAVLRPPLTTAEAGRQVRVMVVDDNVDAAQTLAELLGILGAVVTVAADGEQALDMAAQAPRPELVLLDIGLPGMDGYETAREWRRRFGADSKLVALTGYGGTEDRRRAVQAGFDGHFAKPLSPEDLGRLLTGEAFG